LKILKKGQDARSKEKEKIVLSFELKNENFGL